jgi:hypothetical protein
LRVENTVVRRNAFDFDDDFILNDEVRMKLSEHHTSISDFKCSLALEGDALEPEFGRERLAINALEQARSEESMHRNGAADDAPG